MRLPSYLLSAAALLSLARAPVAAQVGSRGADDEKILRAANVAVDGPGLLALLRRHVPTKEDEARIVGLIRQLADKVFKVREQAGAKLIAAGPPALSALRRTEKEGDLETQRRAQRCIEAIERASSPQLLAAAARLLRQRRPDGACAALLEYLPLAADAAVAEEVLIAIYDLGTRTGKLERALDALFGLGSVGPVDEAVLAALRAPEPPRRAAAALVVGRFGTPEQRLAARRLLEGDDAQVRLRAAQGLLCARDPAAVPALIALLGKGPLPLAQQAEDLLAHVAGEKAPAVSLGEYVVARAKCREAWQEWWHANRERLDLARSDLRSPFAGPTALARTMTRRFLDALGKGDTKAVLTLVDIPFGVDAVAVFRTRAEVEQIFRQATTSSQKYTFTIREVLRMDEHIRRVGREPIEFLKQVPKESLRVVYIEGATNGRQERAAILIRFQGGRARVVGIGQGDVKEQKKPG